jgi:hypothetical protein
MVSPTAADRIVISDGMGGFVEELSWQPQRMISLSDSQYAVLYNPVADRRPEEGPNGNFKPARNESRPLRNGTRNMIPGPCSFYLRPGQEVEVRDAHELASNQYLVVKVYGEVDKDAPYFQITARSAAITTATAEDVLGDAKLPLAEREEVELKRGQLIVIRGLDTQFYIPPTGVDVVPDLSVGDGGSLNAEAARRILRMSPQVAAQPQSTGTVSPAFDADDERPALEAKQEVQHANRFGGVEQAARARHLVQRAAPAAGPGRAMTAPPQVQMRMDMEPMAPPPPPRGAMPEISEDEVQTLLTSEVHRRALEREMRKARLVRQAVVLSEKEFCVLIDADGKRQIKVGPARVFPGPYDSFMTRGADNRIYVAYELLPQRALWLRFVSPISREKLQKKLPLGIELDKETYLPGDEMIITGINTFFFPLIEAEILHPLTGQPHFGNHHADVFIEAIGIDQKSGIYVRDLATGEVRLVKGKQSYLVDPRKEVHITRSIPVDDWNLWIGAIEPHKRASSAITTPWAISINVPHNTAVLAASAAGHRVIEGPCVELLGYDERLVSLSLSTGTPKNANVRLHTCYLRTVGNVVSDVISAETSDFVGIEIRVSYRITMDGEHKDAWFNHEDYVGMVCDHLRSLVRRHCRQHTMMDLWPRLPDAVRDIILGERTEAGRRGRLFESNGLWVTEVEVLESSILDEEIGEFLESVQRESVSLQISDRQADEKLRSEKLRHELDLERLRLRKEMQEKQSELEARLLELKQASDLAELRNREAVAGEESELVAKREKGALEARVEREKLEFQAQIERWRRDVSEKLEMSKREQEQTQAHKQALTELEMALLDAHAKATVAERTAVQPALVEALTALGDKLVLGEVAQNMNLVSLFKGQDIATILSEIVGGTKLERTIEPMLPKKK